jgi:DnaK suppressor protein
MMAVKKFRSSASKKRTAKPVRKKTAVKLNSVKKKSASKRILKRTAKSAKEVKPRKLGKTYLSQKELNYFKELIGEQKAEILENARRLRESIVDESTGDYIVENSTFSMHMAEHGTDEMEREKAFMFIQRDEKHLFYLENALERIEKKTYGLCVTCGKPIDKGRLEAVPITQHCIKCKTSLSNSN